MPIIGLVVFLEYNFKFRRVNFGKKSVRFKTLVNAREFDAIGDGNGLGIDLASADDKRRLALRNPGNGFGEVFYDDAALWTKIGIA